MRTSLLTERSYFATLIAWILIGLMTGGTLVDYLAGPEPSGICTELRVLELEDDKVDGLDIAYIPASGHVWTCSDALPGDIPLAVDCDARHTFPTWATDRLSFNRNLSLLPSECMTGQACVR
jgi:hypothetical protein